MEREITRFNVDKHRGVVDADPVLRNPARLIEENEIGRQYVQKIIDDLRDTVKNLESSAVGLAAPQIGENVAIALVCINPPEGHPVKPLNMIMINPEYEPIGDDKPELTNQPEGCLSSDTGDPETTPMGYTYRYKRVLVRWTDENGERREEVYEGVHAFVIQHEVDHLKGIVFADKTNPEHMTTLGAFQRQMAQKAAQASGIQPPQ